MKKFNFKKERDENGRESVVIADRSKRRINLIPALICLAFAVIIWMYCVNINEDDVIRTFTIKPSIIGTENMADGLSIYNGADIPEVVITVQGTNRDINKYSASDYQVYVDVSTVDSSGWNSVTIDAKVPEGSSLTILSQDKDVTSIYADKSASVVIPIDFDEKNFTRKPAYDYDPDFADNIESITITGPKTIVENIERAKYVLTGDYNTSQYISNITLEFYKKNFGTDEDPRETSSWIKYDPINFVVKITTTASMALIPMQNEDYNYTFDISSVNIKGDPEVLKKFSECVIDVSDYTESGTKLILKDIIPALVDNWSDELVDNWYDDVVFENENATVTVTITPKN